MWLDSSTGVPIGAQVKQSEKGGKLQLVDDEGKVRPLRRHDDDHHKPVTSHGHKTECRTGLGSHGYFGCLLRERRLD